MVQLQGILLAQSKIYEDVLDDYGSNSQSILVIPQKCNINDCID